MGKGFDQMSTKSYLRDSLYNIKAKKQYTCAVVTEEKRGNSLTSGIRPFLENSLVTERNLLYFSQRQKTDKRK